MKCFVCGSNMKSYFSKDWGGMLKSNFVQCEECGLVINKTMYEMSFEEWKLENDTFHKMYQGTEENETDPKWMERIATQARVFSELYKLGIFNDNDRIIDYGCGDGKLATEVNALCESKLILKYDKYMNDSDKGYLCDKDIVPGTFDGVITCSVFEHLIGKNEVQKVFDLLSKQGIFCLHTLVCEMVPQDPEWFYLLPVHCTLWTNKAMSKIYQDNKFAGCAYNLESQMWFMFRNGNQYKVLKEKQADLPGSWFFSDNFVDYWKSKPYRK